MVSLIATSFIIIVSLLFIGLVFYVILRKHSHVSPPDVKNVPCPVLPLDKLRKCTPGAKDCANCEHGEYACFTIDKDHPYKISVNPGVNCNATGCKADPSSCPSCVSVPDGNWCLPVIVESDSCNQFTSVPILTQVTPEVWRWRCDCKYPEIVNKANIDGDCTVVRACNIGLSPKNYLGCPEWCDPECKTGEVCCGDGGCITESKCDPECKDDQICCGEKCYTPPCKSGDKWDGTWDPTNGQCFCDSSLGLKSYKRKDPVTGQYIMECIHDFCKPGSYDNDTGTCACPPAIGTKGAGDWVSYVNCPEDVTDEFKPECQPVGQQCQDGGIGCDHQCFKDPCNPYGYYDKTLGECVCEAPGSQQEESSSSIVNSLCVKPCGNPADPPCGKDPPRGTCYVNSKGFPQCENCNRAMGWEQDPTGMCQTRCWPAGTDCSTSTLPCCSGLSCVEHTPWYGDPYFVCQ